MDSTGVPVLMLWCLLLVPIVGPLFTCPGPDDLGAMWPTEEELEQFGETIEGDLYLPGSRELDEAGKMKGNALFNSWFGAVMFPESADDVQKAIRFANEQGIRPTISSSTHSFVGRSAGDRTFHISLTRMRQIDINPNDPDSPTGKSMRIGTGSSWLDVYTEVDKYNLIAVGGSAHTVSPGGWTLGGGHSPVSRMLGLGVDQVLEFTMVTADASIVTVDANGGTVTKPDGSTEPLYDNGDLWWSVLGGGGGVYGVVTQFKLKLHDPPPNGFVRLSLTYIIMHTGQCAGAASEALKVFYGRLRTDLSNNWGGYVMTNSVGPDDDNAGDYNGTLSFFINYWGGDLEQAKSDMESLTSYRTDCQYGQADWQQYPTFLDYEKTAQDQIYIKLYLIGRLIQVADLADDSGFAELVTSVESVPVDYMNCLCILLGGAANDPPAESTSVNPQMRTARCQLGCSGAWEHDKDTAASVTAMEEFADKLYEYGTGVYYSEAAYYLENWKEDYWGDMERYNRLLRVKQKWDPDNLFWCHNCVGSDLVSHESADRCFNPFTSDKAIYASAGRAAPAVLGLMLLLFVPFVSIH